MTEKKVPKLRFNEFKIDWNIKKFKELVKINQGLQIPISERYSEEIEGSYFYITNEFLKANSEKKYFILNPKKSVLCDVNDILMTRTGNTGVVVTNIRGAFHNNFFKIAYPDTIAKDFLFYFLNLVSTQNNIKRLAGTSTIPDLNHSDFYRIYFSFPPLTEQQKIAEFLSSVDKKIQLLEKKKEQLELYKKGIMQKIFSQEIRFKDDNGNSYPDWESAVLGDIFESKRGQGLSGKNISEDGVNKCILYGALYTNYDEVIYEVVEKTNERGSVQSIIGDLLVPASTTTSGIDLANFTALNEEGVYLGGDITIMRSKRRSCNKFWAYYLTHFKKFDVARYSQGSTIVHLYFNHFKNIEVSTPSFLEQKKIADFISSVDKKIKTISSQIDKTKEFKKGLLQQMFV